MTRQRSTIFESFWIKDIMNEQYIDAILKYLSDSNQQLKPRQLADKLGVPDEEYQEFKQTLHHLEEQGRVVLGAKNAVMLPGIGSQVVGYFRPNPKGFGFVCPQSPNDHGDLFIPPGQDGGAMNGDLVVARVHKRGKRDGEMQYDGQIIEVLRRANNRFVGQFQKIHDRHVVVPDGKQFSQPIHIRDVGAAGPPEGRLVLVEIVEFPEETGEMPAGVIVRELGAPGELEVETRAIILAYGLEEDFGTEAMDYARQRSHEFSVENLDHPREDLRDKKIVTIDPPDARDYDDAISIDVNEDGTWTLGVHIADVSHFVEVDSPLDLEARQLSTSVYFPRRVIPMLPKILSNGVCSLQENQDRLAKSAFITYDGDGRVISARVCESIIRSRKRLTYKEAQSILDGRTRWGGGRGDRSHGAYDPEVIRLVKNMNKLARRIEARRDTQGMLHLDLPAVELILDEQGKVVDAQPEDSSYTHTIIEMFMVEANEAVARLLTDLNRGFLRRIHPEPDQAGEGQLAGFIRAAGFQIPDNPTREDIQGLLNTVKGKPESYAVNLAILKTFQQAEYSPLQIGHFALASNCYCHFTSPIRRYPDLTVHRLLAEHCRGQLENKPREDQAELIALGEHCSAAERRAQSAENELRDVLVLQLMEKKQGEIFDGVVTGVTKFGMFVQWPKYLVEGLIRFENLEGDFWEVNTKGGFVQGRNTGRKVRIGDVLSVRIVEVDVTRRQMDLLPTKPLGGGKKSKSKSKSRGKGGKTSSKRGAKSRSSSNAKGRARRKGNSKRR
jgi:ribonuclease R